MAAWLEYYKIGDFQNKTCCAPQNVEPIASLIGGSHDHKVGHFIKHDAHQRMSNAPKFYQLRYVVAWAIYLNFHKNTMLRTSKCRTYKVSYWRECRSNDWCTHLNLAITNMSCNFHKELTRTSLFPCTLSSERENITLTFLRTLPCITLN